MADNSLNANQLRAVKWCDGPLLVLAGPGSGKTRVLTHRMARIISESAGESFRILGLTFTNKAAAEMRRRVRELVADVDGRINLTTYHSFSADILRQHGHLLGIRPDFDILTQDAERRAVLDEAISSAEVDSGYDSRRLLPLVDRLIEHNVAPNEAARFLHEEMPDDAQPIGEIYGHYRRLMIEGGELDYVGLVAEAHRLLTNTAVAGLIRTIYPYICVDEFQDTSLAEYRLLCELVDPDTRNLFVVADDDQTIYEWNGADPERLQHLRQRFGMHILELPENYRCPPRVVEMANRLIANNPLHAKADSVASRPVEADQMVRTREFETAEEEVKWVAKDIAGRPVSERAECAVLARNRWALEQIVNALETRGIQGHLHVRKNEFANDRMVWLHSALRLANSRQDSEQMRRVCKSFDTLEGTNTIPDAIIAIAMMGDKDYLRAWTRAVLRENLDSTTRSFLEEGMTGLADKLDFRGFIRDCFRWFEQRQESSPAPDYDAYCMERAVWGGLVEEATSDVPYERMTLSALLQQIDLRSKEPPAPPGAVRCYTIFASKGLEFDHTYLVRMAEGELPDWRAAKKGAASREVCEERRICFVAITRTLKSLTLTWPLSMSGHRKEPSRFLVEMGAVQNSTAPSATAPDLGLSERPQAAGARFGAPH